jgi:hypothetical protein
MTIMELFLKLSRKILLILAIGLACGFLNGCGSSDVEKKILEAAAKGDHEAVKNFLDQGVEPDMTCWRASGGRFGSIRSLLAAAVSSGSWETVELLIKEKANKDKALIRAIFNDNVLLAKKLSLSAQSLTNTNPIGLYITL